MPALQSPTRDRAVKAGGLRASPTALKHGSGWHGVFSDCVCFAQSSFPPNPKGSPATMTGRFMAAGHRRQPVWFYMVRVFSPACIRTCRVTCKALHRTISNAQQRRGVHCIAGRSALVWIRPPCGCLCKPAASRPGEVLDADPTSQKSSEGSAVAGGAGRHQPHAWAQ